LLHESSRGIRQQEMLSKEEEFIARFAARGITLRAISAVAGTGVTELLQELDAKVHR
jgi:hypothetical protein